MNVCGFQIYRECVNDTTYRQNISWKSHNRKCKWNKALLKYCCGKEMVPEVVDDNFIIRRLQIKFLRQEDCAIASWSNFFYRTLALRNYAVAWYYILYIVNPSRHPPSWQAYHISYFGRTVYSGWDTAGKVWHTDPCCRIRSSMTRKYSISTAQAILTKNP